MRRIRFAVASLPFLLVLSGLSGCSESTKVESPEVSPEAKKADLDAQKGMMEFMKTKGQSKAKK
jgi:hypothetical protein